MREPSWVRAREGSDLEDTELSGTPYRVVGPIARGGMGEVVAAEHVALGKPVVVKLLHKALAQRPELVDRMRIEAQTLARLAHKNLVTVSDLGQNAEGRTYLVMERLRGRTLREELEARGPLPTAEAIDYVTQALAGLFAAHEVGIVHRDVKLDNLFLCEAEEGSRVVKLLDFGLAKVLAGGGLSLTPLEFPTEEGRSVGTPRFLSPEQARREPVDQRADLYAMGVVLYALLAGRGPFDHHKGAANVLLAHAQEEPQPPSNFAPSPLPARLDHAVLRALAKRPDDRFATAAEMADELSAIARQGAKPGRWVSTEKMASAPAAAEAPFDASAAANPPRFVDPFGQAGTMDVLRAPRSAQPPEVAPAPIAVRPAPVSPAPARRLPALALIAAIVLLAVALVVRALLT